ncbi:MAG: alanine--tRNA ligase, partial [Acidimicrobiales bacterium]
LVLVQDVPTVFETDVMRPLLDEAVRLTGTSYGSDDRSDISLRIMADHARATAFLVSDGIPPSNDERGYVVRRLIRRFVRHAYQLGVEDSLVAPDLVARVIEVMGGAYPELVQNATGVTDIIVREEERFRHTLRTGTILLEEELEKGSVSGEVAFKLHDTFGFPIELTSEIAAERKVDVDTAGFETAMTQQRKRAKAARKAGPATADGSAYRQLLAEHGPTEFTGYERAEEEATVIAVLPTDDAELVELFLDRTPFYAEGGGQVGDTGTIRTSSGLFEIIDTTPALPGLHRHVARVLEGDAGPGDSATAAVDDTRREHTRRNHSGTHLLHAALREVLGPQLRQQGSYVGPDRLRFDINHHAPVTREELEQVEETVNRRVLANEAVRAFETTMDEAKAMGALMFFGDKYGDVVRVVEAGSHSIELCGGTHVHALGTVGPVKILGEGSIGSNLRRIEAVTGVATLARVKDEERTMERAAALLRSKPEELVEAIERLIERQSGLEAELKQLHSQAARGEARQLAASADQGIVVARRDGLVNDLLRDLALAVRNEPEVRAVVLIGSPDGERVAIIVAVEKGIDIVAGEVLVEAAGIVGGGGNPKAADLAIGGGKDPGLIDAALDAVRARLGLDG